MKQCNSNGQGPSPYKRGWRAPWLKQWGSFEDGHSRISNLARRIERELALEYPVPTDLAKRRRRRAARLLAQAEMTMALIGVDEKATPRREMLLRRAAELELKRLAMQAQGNGHKSADLASEIQHELGDPVEAGR
jgi:hypothetical protein